MKKIGLVSALIELNSPIEYHEGDPSTNKTWTNKGKKYSLSLTLFSNNNL